MCVQVILSITSNEDALFVLLYSDDTIILVKNERDLLTALDSVQEYCTKFKRIVNTIKTKLIIISRGKVRWFTTFKHGCDTVGQSLCLPWNTINFNNTFAKAMK